MLSNRITTNINENDAAINEMKTKNVNNLNELNAGKTQRRGLGLRPTNIPSDSEPIKSKALQTSTNIINSHKTKFNQASAKKECKVDEPIKKKAVSVENDKPQKIDENDEAAFLNNPYDALLDVCLMDEVLYEKVLRLELADDGLPQFESSEPFDF